MTNVLLIGLGWQGKKFLEFFKRNKDYKIFGSCKTEKTKKTIKDKYDIDVFLNYKDVLIKYDIDLIILTVFPTDVQYNIAKFIVLNYDIKTIIDLPITFKKDKLDFLLKFKNIYPLNFEHYTKIFNHINNNLNHIKSIDVNLFINKENLKAQTNSYLALKVDKFYCLNNIINFNLDRVNFNYIILNRKIRDIEFILKIIYDNNDIIYYKYYDGKGILLDKEKNIFIDLLNYNIFIPKLLNNVINDINTDFSRKAHMKLWDFIFNE